MKLSLKLFSNLMEHLPSNAEGNTVEINSVNAITCNDLIARYRIPPESVQVVMVNGEFTAQEARNADLKDGDTISIWPSIQGG